jgi:hypothetical protein
VPNVDDPEFIKQTILVLKAQKDFNKMIIGDINTP